MVSKQRWREQGDCLKSCVDVKAEFLERCLKTVIPAERSKVSAGFLFVSLCCCFKPRTRFVLKEQHEGSVRGLVWMMTAEAVMCGGVWACTDAQAHMHVSILLLSNWNLVKVNFSGVNIKTDTCFFDKSWCASGRFSLPLTAIWQITQTCFFSCFVSWSCIRSCVWVHACITYGHSPCDVTHRFLNSQNEVQSGWHLVAPAAAILAAPYIIEKLV